MIFNVTRILLAFVGCCKNFIQIKQMFQLNFEYLFQIQNNNTDHMLARDATCLPNLKHAACGYPEMVVMGYFHG